jgi:hypothetical protein
MRLWTGESLLLRLLTPQNLERILFSGQGLTCKILQLVNLHNNAFFDTQTTLKAK